MSKPLIDTHCHFDFSAFDADREQIWANCLQQNIQKLIIPAVNPAELDAAVALAEKHQGIYFAVGLHPWWLNQNTVQFNENQIARWKPHPKCVAIGECGLDKSIDITQSEQVDMLERHLAIAEKWQWPLILHNRNSNNKLLQLLSQFSLPKGGVVHGFSGSYEIAKAFYDRGFLLGVGGTITYDRANKTREAICKMPLEALLLETDAPDMPLQGKQGRRNSPDSLVEIAMCLAALRNQSLAVIESVIYDNTHALFGLS